MKGQIAFNKARKDRLMSEYEHEKDIYIGELSLLAQNKKNIEERKLLKKFCDGACYKDEYAEALLDLYLDQCKFRHALAFL